MNNMIAPLLVGLTVAGISGIAALLFKHRQMGRHVAYAVFCIFGSISVFDTFYDWGKMNAYYRAEATASNDDLYKNDSLFSEHTQWLIETKLREAHKKDMPFITTYEACVYIIEGSIIILLAVAMLFEKNTKGM